MRTCFYVIALFCVIQICSVTRADVVYVNQNSTGVRHNGVSWKSAFLTVQQAVDAGASGDEVWVAQGAYLEHINLRSGIGLYGGFAGYETTRNQRNVSVNVTILDGNGTDCVVNAGSEVFQVVIDGFTIRNGIGYSQSGDNVRNGGGIYSSAGSISISNNTIVNNSAAYFGGGVYCDGGAGAIDHNLIMGNRAASVGGGLSIVNGSYNIRDNVISGNISGGIFTSNSTSIILNNSIVGNRSSLASIFIQGGNTTFANNIVSSNDSGILENGPILLYNNDVVGNVAYDYRSNGEDPTGTNGNIQVDPMFTGACFHLAGTSPCIDAGNDSYVQSGELDMSGRARIQLNHVDIGAYEFHQYPMYGWNDVMKVLQIAAGITSSSQSDIERLDIDDCGDPIGRIDIADAVRMSRRSAGLDSNP